MIKIPEGLIGKELITFIKENKESLIEQKCAFPKKSDPSDYPYSIVGKHKAASGTKAPGDPIELEDKSEVDIVAIANAANWIDSQMDLLLPDCWKKTIKESGPLGKNRIYHLKDHKQNTDGVIGKISKLYSQDYSLQDLGLPANFIGTTQCLVMESSAKEMLDKKCFSMYSNKMINQHSIGLQYVKMDLAINDSNYPAEFEIWNKYFMQVINKETATSCGYFWVVYEIKLMEVSAVLWGANELTPCIEETEKEIEPSKDTNDKKEPDTSTLPSISEMIAKTKISIPL